jgi:hypothetical protein
MAYIRGLSAKQPFLSASTDFFFGRQKAGYADRILFTGGSNEFLQSKM